MYALLTRFLSKTQAQLIYTQNAWEGSTISIRMSAAAWHLLLPEKETWTIWKEECVTTSSRASRTIVLECENWHLPIPASKPQNQICKRISAQPHSLQSGGWWGGFGTLMRKMLTSENVWGQCCNMLQLFNSQLSQLQFSWTMSSTVLNW